MCMAGSITSSRMRNATTSWPRCCSCYAYSSLSAWQAGLQSAHSNAHMMQATPTMEKSNVVDNDSGKSVSSKCASCLPGAGLFLRCSCEQLAAAMVACPSRLQTSPKAHRIHLTVSCAGYGLRLAPSFSVAQTPSSQASRTG